MKQLEQKLEEKEATIEELKQQNMLIVDSKAVLEEQLSVQQSNADKLSMYNTPFMRTHACTHTRTCMHACTHTYTHMCMHAHTHTHAHTCTHNTHARTHNIHTHTHTHTRTRDGQ